MFVLGVGIGLVMQILVTAVQNAVNPADIGAAALANSFRSMGGSCGTAIFGALYANELPKELASAFAKIGQSPTGFTTSPLTPRGLLNLPPRTLQVVVGAISQSIQVIYHWAVPFGIIAIALSPALPEVKLRESFHPIADEVPMSNADSMVKKWTGRSFLWPLRSLDHPGVSDGHAEPE